MCIYILRLVCENFRRTAVKISFLWGPKHDIYAAVPFSANVTSWYSRNDMQIFTSVIFYMNIIFIAQWLFGGNSKILHCSDVFVRLEKLYKPEKNSSKNMSIFLPRKYDVISQLRHSYAKGPFYVAQLINKNGNYYNTTLQQVAMISNLPTIQSYFP